MFSDLGAIMKVHAFVAAALAMVLGGCASTHSQSALMREAPAQTKTGIVWEVENRNRLFSGELEELRFHRLLSSYIAAYRHWFADEKRVGAFPNLLQTDLLDELPNSPSLPARLRVRYDPRTGSYRCGGEPGPACASTAGLHDWASDPVRNVRVSLTGASGICEWEIRGASSSQPCDKPKTTQVNVGEPIVVRVRADGGTWLVTKVEVRDLKIVALGDSYSAGEGLPHTQWRYYGRAVRKHPADWLDARCHRSLMSGPALTAAYLARRNPHISVTLLHYGCSGASIADGVVGPWSLLETDLDIRRQYKQFGIEGDTFDGLEVSRMIGARDVPASQIERAKTDLTIGADRLEPDVVLVSIGGNDIGFAGIVHALVAHIGVDPDLKSAVVPDERPYTTFNGATFAAAARIADCHALDRIACLEARVKERMLGGPRSVEENAHETLPEQYDRLGRELKVLVGDDTGRVLITQYPNFVMREPDKVAPEDATPDQAVGCVDRPLDKRAGFIPGLVASLPGLGMREGVAEKAETSFLIPLNSTIEEAAERNGWTLVKSHVNNGRTHGYCSLQRYYNTLSDSYWFQGRRYQGTRPLGNVQLLQDSVRFGLPKGTKIVWDDGRACFVRFELSNGPCLAEPTPRGPMEELKRKAKTGQSYDKMVDRGSTWFTTGPVHPNLFGHCNYASAIVTTIVRSQRFSGFDFDGKLKADVARAGADGLKADTVCDVDQGVWGWVRAPAARSPAGAG